MVSCFSCVLFFSFYCLSVTAWELVSSLESPVTGSSNSSFFTVNNVLTFTVADTDGQVSDVNNTRILTGNVSVGTNSGEFYKSSFTLEISNPRYTLTKRLHAMLPTHTFLVWCTSGTILLSKLEQASQVFQETVSLSRILDAQIALLQSSSAASNIARRRLLSNPQYSSEHEPVDMDTLRSEVATSITADAAFSASRDVSIVLNQITNIGAQLADVANITSQLVGVLSDAVNATFGTSELVAKSLNTSAEVLNQINGSLEALAADAADLQTLRDSAQAALAQSNARVDAAFQQMFVQVQSAGSANATLALQTAINATSQQFSLFNTTVASARDLLDSTLAMATVILRLLEDIRLDIFQRRDKSVCFHDRRQKIVDQGLLVPWISKETPAPVPQFRVDDTSLGFNDNGAFLTVTYVYNTATENPVTDNDPDTGYPLSAPSTVTSAQTAKQRNSWDSQQTKSLNNNGSFLFTHSRSFSLACNNDFLLHNRNIFFTIWDLMLLLGPSGCTVGQDCNCWARVDRERCISSNSGFDSSTPASNLASVSGLCQTPVPFGDVVGSWFYNSVENDNSITGIPATEFFTSAKDLNQEIQKVCQTSTLWDQGFYVWSTATFSGNVSRLPSRVDLCSVHHEEMQYESALLASSSFASNTTAPTTVPHAFYLYASFSVSDLFRKISVDQELEYYGELDENTITDVKPLHAIGTRQSAKDLLSQLQATGQTSPPPHFRRFLTTSFLATSQEMVPLYYMCPSPVQQVATLTLTARNGTLVQQQLTLPRYNELESSRLSSGAGCFFWAGYLDCLYEVCSNPLGPSSRPEEQQGNFVFDTHSDQISGQKQEAARRKHLDYVADFTPTTELVNASSNATVSAFAPPRSVGVLPGYEYYRYNPFGNAYLMGTQFDVDKWRRQNRVTRFNPSFSGGSLHRTRAWVVPDDSKGGLICNPRSVLQNGGTEGEICSLLRDFRVMKNNLFGLGTADLDASDTITLEAKVWSVSATVQVPGELLGLANVAARCPSPGEIFVKSSGNFSSASLSVTNTLSNVDVLDLKVIASGAADRCNFQTNLSVPSNQVVLVSLPDAATCPTLSLKVQSQGVVLCWEKQVDMTKIGANYAGKSLLPGAASNTTNNSYVPSLDQSIQSISDRAQTTVAFQNLLDLDSTQDVLETLLRMQTLRLQAGTSSAQLPSAELLARLDQEMQALVSRNQQRQQNALLLTGALLNDTTTTSGVSDGSTSSDIAALFARINNVSRAITEVFRKFGITDQVQGASASIPVEIVDRLRQAQENAKELQKTLQELIRISKYQVPLQKGLGLELVLGNTRKNVDFNFTYYNRIRRKRDLLSRLKGVGQDIKNTVNDWVDKGVDALNELADLTKEAFDYLVKLIKGLYNCVIGTVSGDLGKCCKSPLKVICNGLKLAQKIIFFLCIVGGVIMFIVVLSLMSKYFPSTSGQNASFKTM